jgi:patatin-like phospholipase/acyl hydrolase
MMRRVLSIDGGGVKGVFPASFLASIEDTVGGSIADYFDLIVGTSTGGIIALGLGLGLRARQLLTFYEKWGPEIFGGPRRWRAFRSLFGAKYSSDPMRRAAESVFGNRLLGESRKRLVIPSFNVETGEVHIWKTSHERRLERDYKCRAVEVALSTTAAPTYFPTYQSSSGTPLIDGGMWANNPLMVAMVEAVGVLGWPRDSVRVLSLGCTTAPLDVKWSRSGKLTWAFKIVDVFMTAQATSAYGMSQHLVTDRSNVVRISPVVTKNRFALDRACDIDALKGLGDFEARKALPQLRSAFFDGIPAEQFVPIHKV